MAKFKDLTGETYGRLTVIRRVENDKGGRSRFLCSCECGRTAIRRGQLLTRSEVHSCGCLYKGSKTIDIAGCRYGRLVALEVADERRNNRVVWKCQCDCGNIFYTTAQLIRRGNTRSCGCLKSDMLSLEVGVAALHNVIRSYKHGARERNLEWNLNEDEVRSIVSSNCFYCDAPPSRSATIQDRPINGDFIYNGIDRVDNARGYTIDNAVPCCTQCNSAKKTLGIDEFGKWVAAAYKKFGTNYS
jgi:hypothetical protein